MMVVIGEMDSYGKVKMENWGYIVMTLIIKLIKFKSANCRLLKAVCMLTAKFWMFLGS